MLETQNISKEETEKNLEIINNLRKAKTVKEGEKAIVIKPSDLPLYCPNPGAPVTAKHPGVYLPITPNTDYRCPYCGTLYHLEGEPKKHTFA